MAFFINQLCARHVDGEQGAYRLASMRFMIAKIVKTPATAESEASVKAIFVDGSVGESAYQQSTQSVTFPHGIAKGEYLIVYCAGWTPEHT